MVTNLSRPYCLTDVMRETIVQSVKAFISPKFIKAQRFKHHGKRLYKERNSIYYAHLHI